MAAFSSGPWLSVIIYDVSYFVEILSFVQLKELFFFEAGFLGLFDMSLANSGHKDRISYFLLSILTFYF